MLFVMRDDDGSMFEVDELGEGKFRIRLTDAPSGKTGETLSTFENYPSIMTIMVQAHELINQLRPPAQPTQLVEVPSDTVAN